jgi:trans-2,3-dihydro-3-hydroxyanthranilate isomerase
MASEFDFVLVDAFTDQPLSGNPCAVIFGSDSLDEGKMLAIAKETNQSETAFLMKSASSHLRARYFTPEREIPLAGHPTIACIHAAIEAGLIRSEHSDYEVSLELNDRPIQVEISARSNGKPLIRMIQRKPIFGEVHDSEMVAKLFGLTTEDLLPGCDVQTVSTGTRQLMVPLRSQEALRKLVMDVVAYKKYRQQKDFFSPRFFCLQGITKEGQTFARHLGVSPDTNEDSFTGSATGGMAAYLWKYDLIPIPTFIAEQGHWMGRPGSAVVHIKGSRDDIESVSVAGHAVTVIRGTISI